VNLEPVKSFYLVLFIFAVFAGQTIFAFWFLSRQKAKRQSKPPIELRFLRLPGESLRIRSEALLDQMINWLLGGSLLAIGLFCAPFAVLQLFPKIEPVSAFASSLALFALGNIATFRRVVEIGEERGRLRLGHAGERSVAEELQPMMELGYRVFHDLPITRDGVTTENIDHVAVGPQGLVVIETKTKSISTKAYAGKQEVTFDGERLIWPFFANDKGTVKQVGRVAEWLGKLVRDGCGRDVPVQQIIAIPGWTVVPGKFYNPRAVSGSGVAAAFRSMVEGKPEVLNRADIKRIETKLREMCRDVEW